MKSQGKNLSEIEISNLHDKYFKVMVMEMLPKLKRMVKHSENFNKEIGNISTKQK